MNVAGIKELKNNLSRFLARVKGGEEILITQRGRPIARIIKENQGNKSIYEALGPLRDKGLIAMPSLSIKRNLLVPEEIPGKPISEMVIEDRR